MNLIPFSTNAALLFLTKNHGSNAESLMYGELTCLGRAYSYGHTGCQRQPICRLDWEPTGCLANSALMYQKY